mgnify:CR=1 FL=1
MGRPISSAVYLTALLPLLLSEAVASPLPQGWGGGNPVELHGQAIANDIESQIRLLTVRIMGRYAAGSGVLVDRDGNTYTVLTNWHVVEGSTGLTLLTADGREHPIQGHSIQIGGVDMAIVRFSSSRDYRVASVMSQPPRVGDTVYAAGFPLYDSITANSTLDRGIDNFHLTRGSVSVLPDRALSGGYQLGYTNDIEIGMSGGPIFNDRGQLVGINARIKNRDPSFGVYVFEDGSQPDGALLDRMQASSWGVSIDRYTGLPTPSPQPRSDAPTPPPSSEPISKPPASTTEPPIPTHPSSLSE